MLSVLHQNASRKLSAIPINTNIFTAKNGFGKTLKRRLAKNLESNANSAFKRFSKTLPKRRVFSSNYKQNTT